MESFSQTHVTYVNSEVDVSDGERVCVSGRLNTIKSTGYDNILRDRTAIKANIFFKLDSEQEEANDNFMRDTNSVELLSTIGSMVSHSKTHDQFSLMTHFIPKWVWWYIASINKLINYFLFFFENRSNEDAEVVTSFHQVFVYDDNLRDYVQKALQKKDRIFLKGRLAHHIHSDPERKGRRIYSSFIIAESIHKLARRDTGSKEMFASASANE